MTPTAWGAIATLTIFVLSNIGLMIYWSARISTLLDVVQRELREITAELKTFKVAYVSKEEFTYRIAQSDREHAELNRRLQEIESR